MAPPKITITNVIGNRSVEGVFPSDTLYPSDELYPSTLGFKIGKKDGFDHCVVTFRADQELKGFRARAGGVHFSSGLLVGRSGDLFPSDNLYPSDDLYPQDYTLPVGVEQIFVIYFHELQEDKDYRINVYGLNAEGEWTPHE